MSEPQSVRVHMLVQVDGDEKLSQEELAQAVGEYILNLPGTTTARVRRGRMAKYVPFQVLTVLDTL